MEQSYRINPTEWLLSEQKGAFQKILAFFLSIWCMTIWLYHAFCTYFGTPEEMRFRTIHVTFFLVAAFLFYPLKRKAWNDKFNLFFLVDLLCISLVLVIQTYIYLDFDGLQARAAVSYTNADIFFGFVLTLLVLEASRRTVGLPLTILIGAFFVYSISAEYFPGILNAPQLSFSDFVDRLFIGSLGIYGIAIYVMASFVIMFIFFGAFLLEAGAGEFFIKLAFALTGKRVGGPAKVAVVASAFMGTISGSITANVVSTGSFTIPLMKSSGFKPRVAGAIEAVASTGGMIMPPIMGAVAFIMAFFLGITYLDVCYGAAIPACLYFFSVYLMIHFEAKKTGLTPMVSDQIPNLAEVLKKGGHYLVPVAVIIYFLIRGYSPSMVGFLAIVSVFIVSFRRKNTRLTYRKIVRAMENGVQMAIMVSVGCAAVGVIIAAVGQTGFGARITSIIVESSQGHVFIVVILTMILSFILGMGLTTIVLYISLAATVIPAMVEMGIIPFAAHLAALYYGVLSYLIPPVAFAAFAGASIAGSNPMSTAIIATKYGAALFFVPIFFIFNPVLVLQGPWYSTIVATIISAIAIICLTAALQGWFLTKANLAKRALLFVIFVTLAIPNSSYWLLGLALLGGYIFLLEWKALRSKFRENSA